MHLTAFKNITYIDEVVEAWTDLRNHQVRIVRLLSHLFSINVEGVKKVLREVKPSEDLKNPMISPKNGLQSLTIYLMTMEYIR